MRVGVCQLESKYDGFEENLAKLVRGLERAEKDRVELLAFPETYLTGFADTEPMARKCGFAVDSPQMMKLLDRTARFDPTFVVGFSELRGNDLYNTAAVVLKGHLLGTYSKCTAYFPFEKQGREFPVFDRGGVKFGVVICSDGGYIEPARILALKGAKVILSPHYNSIPGKGLIGHFMHVRADHAARAVENGVHFVRANSVAVGKEEGLTGGDSVGYGDSYVVDPAGEIVARSRRHKEDYFFADLDTSYADRGWGVGRSAYSHREFGKLLDAAAEQALKAKK